MDERVLVLATVGQQERYEVLRRRLIDVERLMHPAKAGSVDLDNLAFVVACLAAVDGGERMPPKPNQPPVAKPGRGRGFTYRGKAEPADAGAAAEAVNDDDQDDPDYDGGDEGPPAGHVP